MLDDLETRRGNTRTHCVESWLWKMLVTGRKTVFMMIKIIMMMMMTKTMTMMMMMMHSVIYTSMSEGHTNNSCAAILSNL